MADNEGVGAEIIAAAARIARLTTSAENAGRIIMATGRGGTGKSTFVALLSRYLESPMLLLDIDPDQSLGTMLGVEADSTQIRTEAGREAPLRTLSDLTSDIEDEDAFEELAGSPATKKIPLLLKWYTQYQSARFDLMSLGPRWTAGDYRSANFLFEFIIPSIGYQYANIVIDSPAGLEHLNRRVVPRMDDIFLVIDPSRKSLAHVDRVRRISEQVGISYGRLLLVGNYEFDDEAERLVRERGETFLGRMEYDAALKHANLTGRSLLDLPEDSPACVSMRRILSRAGYEV